jgi:hypothetical protein
MMDDLRTWAAQEVRPCTVQYLAACFECLDGKPWEPMVFADPESRDAWLGDHAKDHHIQLGLRTLFEDDALPNNHPSPAEPQLRHAWRWYRVEDGLLVSPIESVPLPRNGVLYDVHVFPSAELMNHALKGRWLDHTPKSIKARGYALTMGPAYPPFQEDHNINQIYGSTRVQRYEARGIFTTLPVHSEAYDMPVTSHVDLPTLKRAESG